MGSFTTLETAGAALGHSQGECSCTSALPPPQMAASCSWAHLLHVSGCTDGLLHGLGRGGGRISNQLAAKSTGVQMHTYSHTPHQIPTQHWPQEPRVCRGHSPHWLGVSSHFREEAEKGGLSLPPSSYLTSVSPFLQNCQFPEKELGLWPIAMNTELIQEMGGRWVPGGRIRKKELKKKKRAQGREALKTEGSLRWALPQKRAWHWVLLGANSRVL